MKAQQVKQFAERFAPDEDTAWQWLRAMVGYGYSLSDSNAFIHPEYQPIGVEIHQGQVVWRMVNTNFVGQTPVAVATAVELNPETAKVGKSGQSASGSSANSQAEMLRRLYGAQRAAGT